MTAKYDCIVAGSCVVDVLCRPVNLDQPIGHNRLHAIDPLLIVAGGITSNAGIALARMGMKTGIFSYVGADSWAPILRDLYRKEGVDDSIMMVHPTAATSTTVVAVDPSSGGERSFFHCVGAPRLIDAKVFLDRMELWSRCRMLLLGYYSLLPHLEPDLPEVFRRLREVGCQTALDAIDGGGTMGPLRKILPHTDVFVPSLTEASHITGEEDPRKIIELFRACGAPGILGVKMGRRGVLLSPKAGDWLQVPIVEPPGPVVDTTGAGDAFYAGLIAGLLKGLSIPDAGRLGAAAGACAVTTLGGCTGGRDYPTTARLAGLEP